MTEATKHIALVCPGGPVARDVADKTVEIAAARFGDAAKLHFHPQCFLEAGHFAGTDQERSAAFLEVVNDPKYDAVWFARGGYGACRLDEALWDRLNETARLKIYFGYSDSGVILARLYALKIGRPVHGPIPVDLTRENGKAAVERALDYLVTDDLTTLEPTAAAGKPVAAFNIAVLASLASASWMPELSGHIVMLEDVGEYLYRIDRSLFAIFNAPFMRGVAGIKLGRVSAVPENDRPFGANEEDIMRYWCDRVGVPYLGRADIGHDADNKIVPFGGADIS